MNEKVLRVLEYNKIIEQLEAHATSDPGRRCCRELQPMSAAADIELAQTQTEDALQLIFRKGSVSFGSNRDFSGIFRALAIEAPLSAPELLYLASFLENIANVRSYGRADKTGVETEEEAEKGSSLYDLFDGLAPLTRLSEEIRRCVLSDEDIADDASPELKRIRRGKLQANERIHAQLQKMVNVSLASYLQDSVITVRDDRYCLPVKAEYKAQVPGIVHDQSSTGSTLFIEPSSVVELNNSLRELEQDEKKEIEKILADLSLSVGEHLIELKDDARNMTSLDFIFARASLAIDEEATRPVFNDRQYIELHKARHPLIAKKKVVPIDISIGSDYDMIIITGPNTGGKTVTLKTVGLLTLMGMAGLHIPAGDRSELSTFREVFADIGDEQSIEQNLSTFSSHMKSIVDILARADRKCLCLFDELGAGTDPTEGAALAISILNFMHTRGIRTLATTHYSELKVYAMRTEGVENASCEFDVETLQPTYRLIMGVAGKSNAFAISRKLGLPNYIIETAREQMSQETKNFEDLLTELENTRSKAEKEKEEADALRARLDAREKQLDDREKMLSTRRDDILRKANEEARDILADAKQEADEAIADIRRSAAGHAADADMAGMERRRSELRDRVSEKSAKLSYTAEPPKKGRLKPGQLTVGDRVKVLSMGLTGTVSTLPDKKGKLFVMCGIMRTQVQLDDLELIAEDAMGRPLNGKAAGGQSGGRNTGVMKKAFEKAEFGTAGADLDFGRASSISPEVSLLGMTTDEAVLVLDKYLDDARLAHLTTVRVVHGKGTGALRGAVWNYLRRQKWVKSYRLGDFGEGDAGVTVVSL
ncbi:MAG: endonuclease MutS2 [Lachnospiraceae bacterium]|jgi:DNA mismatch repair protein MutS2|nr:endonuclease MutS2 [Lachnospiraceae bacterium]